MLKNWHFYKNCILTSSESLSQDESVLGQRMHKIEQYIATLNENDKKIITMRYFECCKMEDVARRLSMHRTSVHKRIKSIVKKLQYVCIYAN